MKTKWNFKTSKNEKKNTSVLELLTKDELQRTIGGGGVEFRYVDGRIIIIQTK